MCIRDQPQPADLVGAAGAGLDGADGPVPQLGAGCGEAVAEEVAVDVGECGAGGVGGESSYGVVEGVQVLHGEGGAQLVGDAGEDAAAVGGVVDSGEED